jgi:hypothetical protein
MNIAGSRSAPRRLGARENDCSPRPRASLQTMDDAESKQRSDRPAMRSAGITDPVVAPRVSRFEPGPLSAAVIDACARSHLPSDHRLDSQKGT